MDKERETRLLKAVNAYLEREWGEGSGIGEMPKDGIIDLAYTSYECADGEEHEVQVSFDVSRCEWRTFVDGELAKRELEPSGIDGFIELMGSADFDGLIEGTSELAYERYGDPDEEERAVLMQTHRSGYSPDQCGRTMTVAELIDALREFDGSTPVYFSNDGGYTYGQIGEGDIRLGRLHQ